MFYIRTDTEALTQRFMQGIKDLNFITFVKVINMQSSRYVSLASGGDKKRVSLLLVPAGRQEEVVDYYLSQIVIIKPWKYVTLATKNSWE